MQGTLLAWLTNVARAFFAKKIRLGSYYAPLVCGPEKEAELLKIGVVPYHTVMGLPSIAEFLTAANSEGLELRSVKDLKTALSKALLGTAVLVDVQTL
jgi:hypothetical protein